MNGLFTLYEHEELEIRKIVEDAIANNQPKTELHTYLVRSLLFTIDNLRSQLTLPEKEHFNTITGAPLPPVGVWLHIKDERTKLFGEGSFKAKRTKHVSGSNRGKWEMELESGVVEMIDVVEWAHV